MHGPSPPQILKAMPIAHCTVRCNAHLVKEGELGWFLHGSGQYQLGLARKWRAHGVTNQPFSLLTSAFGRSRGVSFVQRNTKPSVITPAAGATAAYMCWRSCERHVFAQSRVAMLPCCSHVLMDAELHCGIEKWKYFISMKHLRDYVVIFLSANAFSTHSRTHTQIRRIQTHRYTDGRTALHPSVRFQPIILS